MMSPCKIVCVLYHSILTRARRFDDKTPFSIQVDMHFNLRETYLFMAIQLISVFLFVPSIIRAATIQDARELSETMSMVKYRDNEED